MIPSSPPPLSDTASRRPVLPGVPRWPATVALVVLAVAYLFLPEEFTVGPRFLVSALIAGSVLLVRLAHWRASLAWTHRLFLGITGGICATVVFAAVALITEGLFGNGMTPRRLLAGAALIWVLNVFAFALVYWTVDGGGPAKRRMDAHVSDDFIFPQMTQDDQMRAGWYPSFLDYLFLSFNTSTAFSPTDTLVLSRPAKVLFMVQSLISLTVIAVLVARGINTLSQ